MAASQLAGFLMPGTLIWQHLQVLQRPCPTDRDPAGLQVHTLVARDSLKSVSAAPNKSAQMCRHCETSPEQQRHKQTHCSRFAVRTPRACPVRDNTRAWLCGCDFSSGSRDVRCTCTTLPSLSDWTHAQWSASRRESASFTPGPDRASVVPPSASGRRWHMLAKHSFRGIVVPDACGVQQRQQRPEDKAKQEGLQRWTWWYEF
jgi:hypothetical protein